eukprot:14590267-Alexandrium_andersonii.AAC.3
MKWHSVSPCHCTAEARSCLGRVVRATVDTIEEPVTVAVRVVAAATADAGLHLAVVEGATVS